VRTARQQALVRVGAAILLILLGGPVLVAPIALNVVSLAVLRPDSLAPSQVDAAVSIGRAMAWGPLGGRFSNAAAAIAHQRGDTDSEVTYLTDAAAASPSDADLAARLAELRLAQGDTAGAISAWKTNRLLIRVPLSRGAAAVDPASALDWFGVAQAVDPTDSRPYSEAARVLIATRQPDRAAPFLAQSFTLARHDPSLAVVAQRLLDPFATLDAGGTTPTLLEVDSLWRASQVLTARGDFLGAMYTDELALRADPSNPTIRADLTTLRRRFGRPGP
jgi:hypothetical protein